MIYVILAHYAPESLQILVEKLEGKENHFVIHIDKECDITPFQKIVKGIKNCHFTPQRYTSTWGSFALVEATLHAFDYTRKTIKKRQRIILLSGLDYPIKNCRYIRQYLKGHKDTIFIQYETIPRNVWKKINGGINRFPAYDLVTKQLKLYGGSQWFSIPNKVLPIIFSFLKMNPDFLEYFSYVAIPDESFFQTLFLNCDHPYIKRNLRNQNLHYIKWDKPYQHPRILTLRNYEQIIKSKSLFARKFDPIHSRDLRLKLDGIPTEIVRLPKKTTAIIFLTDKPEDQIAFRYKKLKNEAKRADVFKILTKKEHLDHTAVDTLLYEHSYYKTLGYVPLDKNNIVPGSTYFALLHFCNIHPNYNDYWLIEDDVWYNGNWEKFFNRFEENNADFISAYFTNYMETPHWHWWNTISTVPSIPLSHRLRTFYPICRFSRNALQFLDKKLKAGNTGHGEVLIPTLLHLNGFSYYDISDSYNDKTKTPFIIPCSHKAVGSENTGSFRFRPIIRKEEVKDEFLYHPLKEDSFF